MVAALVETLGVGLIVAAAYLVALPLALVVGGIWLVVTANTAMRGRGRGAR